MATVPSATIGAEADGPSVVDVDPCSGDACEVGLTFSAPVVSSTDAPLPHVTLSPDLAGTWRWTSPSSLAFLPESGPLAPGQTLSVALTPSSDKAIAFQKSVLNLSVPVFSFGGKVANWPVVVGEPRFVGFLNQFSLAMGDGPVLALYDQPVDPAAIAPSVDMVTDAGRHVPLTVSTAASAPYLGLGPLPRGHVIALMPLAPLTAAEVTLSMPTVGQPSVWPLTVSHAAGVKEVRLVDRANRGTVTDVQRIPTQVSLQVAMAHAFAPEVAEHALHLSPPPETTSTSSSSTLTTLDVTLKPGTTYTLTFDEGTVDVLGNVSPAYATTFRTQDLTPVLAAPKLALSTEGGRAAVPVRAVNVTNVVATATRVTTGQFAALQRSRAADCPATESDATPLAVAGIAGAINSPTESVLTLPGPGLWCLTLEAKGAGSGGGDRLHTTAALQASDLAVTAKVSEGNVFVWVTNVDDATPHPGATVSLRRGRTVATGRSMADGTVALACPSAHAYGLDGQLQVVVTDGDDALILPLNDERLSAPWQFGVTGATDATPPLAASVFTERGAYRPGDTVHVTALMGPTHAGDRANITVLDARGQEVLSETRAVDAFGTVTLAVPTVEGAAVGMWSAQVAVGDRQAVHRFRVEEYRVPSFQVSVATAPRWTPGAPVDVALSASYLHGGTLDGRAIRWEITRSPAPFAPDGLSRYRFTRDDTGSAQVNGTVASGSARLDGAGTLAVPFTPPTSPASGPLRYTVQATVTDVDRQAYLGLATRTVHPAGVYVGVRPPPHAVIRAGDVLDVPVVTVTPAGTVADDVPVHLTLSRVDHHNTTRLTTSSAETTSRPVAVPVDDCELRTTGGRGTCHFTVPEAGQWRVIATARDANQREVSASFPFYATGGGAGAWPRFERERVAVRADRSEYAPGDVATLLIESPFAEATALVTLEANGVLSHQTVQISGNTPAIRIPITAALAPNAFATVSLLRGRVHDRVDATGFGTGAPAFRLGTVNLHISRDAQRLRVAIDAPDVSAPGETVPVDITVTDATGAAVDGQAVVMIVDEAVLGLTAMATPDPVAALYPDRPLGVRTGDSRLELPDAQHARHEVLFPGGDGADILGQLPANLLRHLFESTAFFDAQVPVSGGHAHLQVPLPDGVTTYRVMVLPVDAAGRAGSGAAPLLVRKPLMVQAVTPRFAYPGDQLRIEALVHNGTEQSGEVSVTASAVGLTLDGATGGHVTVPAGGTGSVPLTVTVTGHDEAVLRFLATSGAHTDAIEVRLPILAPGVARTQVVTTSVSQEGEISVHMPDDRVPGSERLELVASTSSLTELKDAVGYLMGYPHGCIEQTTSRAYPLVVLADLLPEIGVDVDPVALHEYATAGVARILSFQTDGGGLSYWPGGDQPHAFATAFGLTALIAAKERGYDVPDEALSRMGDYLQETLSQGDITTTTPHGDIADGDTRALFIMTLGQLGRPQPAWVERLWAEHENLSPFGLAFLGIAASDLNADHPLLPQIFAAMQSTASHDDDEAWYEGDPRGGFSMDSPLRTDAAALLASASVAHHGDLAGPYLSGLLARRRGGLWGNTQENVYGIMAVHRAVASQGSAAPVPGLTLTRNGTPVPASSLSSLSTHAKRRTWTADELGSGDQRFTVTRTAGVPLTLTLRASYDLALTPENRAPTHQHAAITRTFETLDGTPLTDTIPLGSLVRVTLHVHTDQPLNYVAIDDKLPAGLEPLNTDLVTTERVDLGALTPALQGGVARLSYREIRDHRVAFYADDLPAGDWAWRYVARATTPGTFLRPAARVEAMYDANTFATTAIDNVEVR